MVDKFLYYGQELNSMQLVALGPIRAQQPKETTQTEASMHQNLGLL